MAATNTSAATATVIASIPYMVTLSAADVQSAPGLTHDLWWKYENTSFAMVSMHALGSLYGVSYPVDHTFNVPTLQFWTGTPGSLVAYPPSFAIVGTGGMQTPFLTLPVTVYMQVKVGDDGVHATEPVMDPLSFRVMPGPQVSAPIGSLLVPDFDYFWPAVVVGTNGQMMQTPLFAGCDFGAVLDDGTIALLDNSTNPMNVKIYSPAGVQVADVAGLTSSRTFQQIQGDGVSTFFVGKSTASVAAVISTVSRTGVVGGTTWTLPANSKQLSGMAPNRAGTILYYTSLTGGSSGNNVRRYDLIGNAPLTDLAGNVAGSYFAQKDLYVMKDGSILVGYVKSGSESQIIRYDPSGAVLNTYVGPSDLSLNRFALGTDDPDSFWVWSFVLSNPEGLARFIRYRTSDGVELESFDAPVFSDGLYQFGHAETNTPPKFGVSNSCPLIVIRKELLVPDTPPPPTTDAPIPCCCRACKSKAASGAPNAGHMEPPINPAWTAVCRGGGAVPTQADIVNAEDWSL